MLLLVRGPVKYRQQPLPLSWGIPCRICGWRWWRTILERFVVRTRSGEAVRRRDGRLTRFRVRHPMQMTEREGWCCRHCIGRLGLAVSSLYTEHPELDRGVTVA